MPLPFILGGIAAAAAVAGVGSGIKGGMKMKDANDTMESAKRMQRRAINKFEENNKKTTKQMDSVGKTELSILSSFEEFADLMENIQGRPEFEKYSKEDIKLPEYTAEELREVSVGAGVLMGGLGGAAAGTAGGFAAAGATTSAVMALGTASTGTAIASLSGAAATNAALAALGGGVLGTSAYAGGMALGSAVLGGATLGVGLLVGGMIFNVTGSKLSEKADEAYYQARKTEKCVDEIVGYLKELYESAKSFEDCLKEVKEQYQKRMDIMKVVVYVQKKINWDEFTETEKEITENLILLVGLLYKMCQVKLVLQTEDDSEVNKVNKEEIDKNIGHAEEILSELHGITV